MSTVHESLPSIQDQHGDANIRTSALPDESYIQPADAFPDDSPDEIEAMYQDWLARQQPAAKSYRCWMSDGGMKATVIANGKRLDVKHVFMLDHLSIYKRIDAASFEAWRGHDGKPPTGKAFVELTDAEIAILAEVSDRNGPLPILKPIASKVRMPNPAAWGQAS